MKACCCSHLGGADTDALLALIIDGTIDGFIR
jgi:hypothetical protein